MNLIKGDIDEIATTVKMRLLSRGGVWELYANNFGRIALVDANSTSRRAMHQSCLVGIYTKQAKVADIADDLEVRLKEIAA